MQLTIRLYRRHDMDLIGLTRVPQYHLAREVKRMLNAAGSGQRYSLELPDNMDEAVPGYVPAIVRLIVILDNKKDKDAISHLKSIESGFRNAYIKMLIRNNLVSIPLCFFSRNCGFVFTRNSDSFDYDIAVKRAEEKKKAQTNKKKGDASNPQRGAAEYQDVPVPRPYPGETEKQPDMSKTGTGTAADDFASLFEEMNGIGL